MNGEKLPDPPCGSCTAACCRRGNTGHGFAVTLDEGEEADSFKDVRTDFCGDWVVPFDSGGNCVFLRGSLCSIYERRPSACRAFNCLTGWDRIGPGCHSPFLEASPAVLELARITLGK